MADISKAAVQDGTTAAQCPPVVAKISFSQAALCAPGPESTPCSNTEAMRAISDPMMLVRLKGTLLNSVHIPFYHLISSHFITDTAIRPRADNPFSSMYTLSLFLSIEVFNDARVKEFFRTTDRWFKGGRAWDCNLHDAEVGQ
jgi:hypothetical protein